MQQENLFEQYPVTPGFKRTDTSAKAAESMKPSKETLQQHVLAELAKSPATSFELSSRMGISYAAVQPRTSELRLEGKIVDSGERRKSDSGRNAIVWKLK